jgi:hypothetical protein
MSDLQLEDELPPKKKRNGFKLFPSFMGMTTQAHFAKLQEISKKKNIPLARLIAIAIDNEFQKENPFEFDTTLPEAGTYEEYAFANEAGMIIRFLQKMKHGAELPILLLLRNEIGVPDKTIFLAAFKEALDLDFIRRITQVRRGRPFKGYIVTDRK